MSIIGHRSGSRTTIKRCPLWGRFLTLANQPAQLTQVDLLPCHSQVELRPPAAPAVGGDPLDSSADGLQPPRGLRCTCRAAPSRLSHRRVAVRPAQGPLPGGDGGAVGEGVPGGTPVLGGCQALLLRGVRCLAWVVLPRRRRLQNRDQGKAVQQWS